MRAETQRVPLCQVLGDWRTHGAFVGTWGGLEDIRGKRAAYYFGLKLGGKGLLKRGLRAWRGPGSPHCCLYPPRKKRGPQREKEGDSGGKGQGRPERRQEGMAGGWRLRGGDGAGRGRGGGGPPGGGGGGGGEWRDVGPTRYRTLLPSWPLCFF